MEEPKRSSFYQILKNQMTGPYKEMTKTKRKSKKTMTERRTEKSRKALGLDNWERKVGNQGQWRMILVLSFQGL